MHRAHEVYTKLKLLTDFWRLGLGDVQVYLLCTLNCCIKTNLAIARSCKVLQPSYSIITFCNLFAEKLLKTTQSGKFLAKLPLI